MVSNSHYAANGAMSPITMHSLDESQMLGFGTTGIFRSVVSILPPTTIRRIIVTPLTSKKPYTPSHNTAGHTKSISKVLIKVFTKGTKKDPKMLTLRNIKPDEVSTVCELECVIRDQLCDEISESSFDIGLRVHSRESLNNNKECRRPA